MRALFKFFGYLLGTLLLVVSSWIHDEYGRVTIDQVLYHIGFGTDALLASDPELSLRLIHEVAWPAFGTGILLTLCDAFVTRAGRHRLARTLAGSHGLLQGAARVATAVADRVLASLAALYRHRPHLLMPLAGLFQFGYSFAVVDYVRAHYGPDLFAAAYVDPARVTKRGGEPTNLVVIYVESLENTYADPALFGHDLLARLNRLKPQGISFDAYHEVLGAHFTIAGLVSTQCGIPLRSLAMFLGNKQGERIGRFLPRASCLGDILHHNGYTNVFLNGSSLEFAGVGKFFREHHFDKIMGIKRITFHNNEYLFNNNLTDSILLNIRTSITDKFGIKSLLYCLYLIVSDFKNFKFIFSLSKSFLSYKIFPPIELIYILAFSFLQILMIFSCDFNALSFLM